MRWEEEAYKGIFAKYRSVPWLHQLDHAPMMPWVCEQTHPYGYVVFVSSGGTIFKVLNNLVIFPRDVLE